ncbi:hypothetical protein WJX77_000837 [Trebouxia sp. C0004]
MYPAPAGDFSTAGLTRRRMEVPLEAPFAKSRLKQQQHRRVHTCISNSIGAQRHWKKYWKQKETSLKRPGQLTDPEEECLASIFGTLQFSGTAGAFRKLKSDADNFGYEIGTFKPSGLDPHAAHGARLIQDYLRMNDTSSNDGTVGGLAELIRTSTSDDLLNREDQHNGPETRGDQVSHRATHSSIGEVEGAAGYASDLRSSHGPVPFDDFKWQQQFVQGRQLITWEYMRATWPAEFKKIVDGLLPGMLQLLQQVEQRGQHELSTEESRRGGGP